MDYERDAVAVLKGALEALPERERRKVSTREAIEEMAETISASLAKGYTQQEIAQLLTDRGMRVAPNTLRAYLRNRRSKGKRKLRQNDRSVEGEGGGMRAHNAPATTREVAPATATRTAPARKATFPFRPDDNDL